MTTEDALPALPAPITWDMPEHEQVEYTADQMRAYALAALTLVQAERDAMQQGRDELRAALEKIADWAHPHMNESRAFCMRKAARAALTPKATQQAAQGNGGAPC